VDAHGFVSVSACAAHLAFSALAFLRRAKSPLGVLVALLFFDAFVWNFASLAYEFSGQHVFERIDHLFASVMAAIALHVVVVFVGRLRALQALVVADYALLGSVGLFAGPHTWWKFVLVLGPLSGGFAIGLLVWHLLRTSDASERTRAKLLLFALAAGTLAGCTDLVHGETPFPIPRLAAAGTLFAVALFAVAALRLELFGGEIPRVLGVYALLLGVTWATLYFVLPHWLDSRQSSWVLSGVAFVLVAFAAAREIRRLTLLAALRNSELTTLGRFSEQLAHDVKNPLAAMKGALQFLEQEQRLGRSLDAHANFLRLMLEQVERMQRVVDDYRRIGKVVPRPTRLSLNALVKDVLPLQRFGVAAGVSIDAELAANLPECRLDRDLVVTALENILQNACDAMPDGGAITVRTSYQAEAGRVSVRVEDEGVGMDARQLERAPALFYTTKAQGTGLGLSFAERVARAHGGSLTLTSALGRGTVATMSFSCSNE
jgi:signal transduction histidine kinase